QERWQCRCECGRKVAVFASNLTRPPLIRFCSRGCPLRPKPDPVPKKERRCWWRAKNQARRERVPFHKPWRTLSVFLADLGNAPNPDCGLFRREPALGWVPGNVFWGSRETRFHRERPRYLTW